MGERFVMITVPELAADALGTFLANYMHRRYGTSGTRLVELVPSIARIAMECIGNSDALYHNVEHTMLVTLTHASRAACLRKWNVSTRRPRCCAPPTSSGNSAIRITSARPTRSITSSRKRG